MLRTSPSSASTTASAATLVACNIYVSAGRSHHATILSSIVKRCQERCQQLRLGQIKPSSKKFFQRYASNNNDHNHNHYNNNNNHHNNKIALIHAYADGPYDRSSFHLAGNADLVADVASYVTLDTIHHLTAFMNNSKSGNSSNNKSDNGSSSGSGSSSSRHPLIGLVDHISIMPLTNTTTEQNETSTSTITNGRENDQQEEQKASVYIPKDSQGLCSVYIGNQLLSQEEQQKEGNKDQNEDRKETETKTQIEVLYYGSADKNQTPLATIRREKTNFFKSGGLDQDTDTNTDTDTDTNKMVINQCTIGSPTTFVENYNILLSQNVTRKKAITLTKKLRGRNMNKEDGNSNSNGIIGVEALTLPYSKGRYEVACNLLQPEKGGVDDIERFLDEWVRNEQHQLPQESHDIDSVIMNANINANVEVKDRDFFVDNCYRVGTTVQQCLDVLEYRDDNNNVDDDNNDFMNRHDASIADKFHHYLTDD